MVDGCRWLYEFEMLRSNYSLPSLSTDRKLIHHHIAIIIHFTLIPYQLEQVKYYEIASNIASKHYARHTLFFPGTVMTFDRFAREKNFFSFHFHIIITFWSFFISNASLKGPGMKCVINYMREEKIQFHKYRRWCRCCHRIPAEKIYFYAISNNIVMCF